MPTIADIMRFMRIWNNQTYRVALDNILAITTNEEVFDLTANVLQLQNLTETRMNGYSVQRLPYICEGHVDVVFSEVFWRMIHGYISPAYYVGLIVRECLGKDINNDVRIAEIVGRGLRSLPSFIREVDLHSKVGSFLPNAEVTNGAEQDVREHAEQDVRDHTDILINYNEHEYRMWSYQSTDWGLDNTSHRFCEERGNLPDGYIVMAPIDIGNPEQVQSSYGWKLYSEEYVRSICEMIVENRVDDYDETVENDYGVIKDYLKEPRLIYKGERFE